jgi:hypothetical protein
VAIWSRRSRRFCPLLGRVRTDKPRVSAWPTAPQADDRVHQGGTGEGGVAHTLLVTDGGPPFQRPHPRRLATGPRGVVQDDAARLPCVSVPPGLGPQRHVRPTPHTCQATGVTRVEHVAHRWRRTAPGLRDPCGVLSLRARAPHLAAAHSEGLRTAPSSGEDGALFVCDVAERPGGFHHAEPITLYPTCTKTLLKLH